MHQIKPELMRRVGRLSLAALFGTVFAAAPVLVHSASAQDDGHEDGGHEDGGHEDGGHEDGGHEDGGGGPPEGRGPGGGHDDGDDDDGDDDGGDDHGDHEDDGGPPDGHGPDRDDAGVIPDNDNDNDRTAVRVMTPTALPPDSYLRIDAGLFQSAFGDPFWDPAGEDDPRVFFDFADGKGPYAAAAVGRDFGAGLHGELGLHVFGRTDAAGGWSVTDPVTPGPHADVDASVQTLALMATGYYFPLATSAPSDRVQPWLSVGGGIALNNVDDWTRTNPASEKPVRSYAGATTTDLAWSVGIGLDIASDDLFGGRPSWISVGFRHFDLGTASGGDLSDDGGQSPRMPITFDLTQQVFTIGVTFQIGG
jgi:hypothetical protein